MLVRDDGFVPKERYTTVAFADLEFERLWSRVWQVACREEELAAPGDYVEYTIGDESVLVVRGDDGAIRAFHNACLHRGTRLAGGAGPSTTLHPVPVPRVAVRARRSPRARGRPRRLHRPPRRPRPPTGARRLLRRLRVRQPRRGRRATARVPRSAPELLAPYHLDRMRLRGYRTTIIDANWKAVVDAFNEGYHVQGLHPQILPWTDDVSIAYEQLGGHAHYGRLPGARRALRPSPRLRLAGRLRRGRDPRRPRRRARRRVPRRRARRGRRVADDRSAGRPDAARGVPGARLELLAARGVDVSGFGAEQMTSAEDVHWFPNLVGPIYPGSALLFRVRPHGRDPDRSVKDTWVLEWPRPTTSGGCRRAASTRLDRAGLGHDHRAGLRESRRGPARHEVVGLRGALAEPAPRGQHPPDAPGHRPLSRRDLTACRRTTGRDDRLPRAGRDRRDRAATPPTPRRAVRRADDRRLRRLGPAGWHCLESVPAAVRWRARWPRSSRPTATCSRPMSTTGSSASDPHLEFRVHDITRDPLPAERFDLAHAGVCSNTCATARRASQDGRREAARRVRRRRGPGLGRVRRAGAAAGVRRVAPHLRDAYVAAAGYDPNLGRRLPELLTTRVSWTWTPKAACS